MSKEPENADQLTSALLARMVGMETVLKMFVSIWLAQNVDDPLDTNQVATLAGEIEKSLTETMKQTLAGFPDKTVADFIGGIATETVTSIMKGAAEQVRQTGLLHFAVPPSRTQN